MATHFASRYAAIEAAFDLLQSQQRLFGMIHSAQHKLYGHSFYTIHAGVFLTTVVLKHFDTDLDMCIRALQELQQASIRLACMKERSSLATTGEQMLRQCCAVIETKTTLPFSINSPIASETDERVNSAINFFQNLDHDVPQDAQELVSLLTLPADPMLMPYAESASESTAPWQF